ncbi:hypothetical protein [Pseudoduganella aquatica]|uniref:Uncharacterized protein n=1 Tax=Pseudoduganella aquatica TaxID=2660641 RepID=A0A7X4KMG8_9BURK|nr:hypothetical protein [Pseudoduganella aquatica]MYN09249.1 hypothetical protein [Pseudoduganella aquatica]
MLATLAVGGAGLWLYKESKVEQSLSVLARAPIPARHAMPAPAAHAQASDTQYAQQALATQPAAATAAAADAPPLLAALPPPQAGSQEAPPAIASAPDRIRKRASAPRSRTASAAAQLKVKSAIDKPGRTAPLAETLRLCRAAGYHAAKCVQLDCTATQYGLACKGARNVRR